MFSKKFEALTEAGTKDRVSAVWVFIFSCGFIYTMTNYYINYYVIALILLVLIADIVWIYFMLPIWPDPTVLSKGELRAAAVFGLFIFAVLIVQAACPQIIPEWKNIAIECMLFAGLTYFAISTPTFRDTW